MPSFVVLAHDHPAQVARLVRHLAPDPVILSLDGCTPRGAFSEAERLSSDLIHGEPRWWGGYSIAKATLQSYKAAATITLPTDYVVLLSGLSYPIKPLNSLRAFLAGETRQFATSIWLSTLPRQLVDHFALRWYFDSFHGSRYGWSGRMLGRSARWVAHYIATMVTARRPTTGIAYGSQWTALTGAAVRWLLDAAPVSHLSDDMRTAFAPDELLIPSLLANSGLAGTMPREIQKDALSTDWHRVRDSAGFLDGNLHILPKDLSRIHTGLPQASEIRADKFFIRKVHPERSADLLKYLDAKIGANGG